MEESAIREGLLHLQPSSDFDRLEAAADCGDKADWLIGMNASRLFRTAVGRVQSPTLALVAERETAIPNFKPSFSYVVHLEKEGISFSSEKFETKEEAQQLCNTLIGLPLHITDIKNNEQKQVPPKLYDLTMLQ